MVTSITSAKAILPCKRTGSWIPRIQVEISLGSLSADPRDRLTLNSQLGYHLPSPCGPHHSRVPLSWVWALRQGLPISLESHFRAHTVSRLGPSPVSGLPYLPSGFLSLSPHRPIITRPSFRAGFLGSQTSGQSRMDGGGGGGGGRLRQGPALSQGPGGLGLGCQLPRTFWNPEPAEVSRVREEEGPLPFPLLSK